MVLEFGTNNDAVYRNSYGDAYSNWVFIFLNLPAVLFKIHC